MFFYLFLYFSKVALQILLWADGFTESGLMYMPIDIGEHKECDSIMESLGICTNSAQVNIVINAMFSVDENNAELRIIVDQDQTVDHIQITDMVFEGDVIVRNNDNEIIDFPEEINNKDQWILEAKTNGKKKLISYSYKVFFINDGDQEEKQPITIVKNIDLGLGEYTNSETECDEIMEALGICSIE